MTLAEIASLMRVAQVPRSKTIETLWPNPLLAIHVPTSHYLVVTEVVRNMVLPGQNVRVHLLESADVREREHVIVKVRGATEQWAIPNDGTDWTEQRRRRRETLRQRNHQVMIECASVVL